MAGEDAELLCARCGRQVRVNRDSYQIFERMHYVCFHYEFEHYGDPDEVCDAGGCPSAVFAAAARPGSAGSGTPAARPRR
jgi:hypothetical protein